MPEGGAGEPGGRKAVRSPSPPLSLPTPSRADDRGPADRETLHGSPLVPDSIPLWRSPGSRSGQDSRTSPWRNRTSRRMRGRRASPKTWRRSLREREGRCYLPPSSPRKDPARQLPQGRRTAPRARRLGRPSPFPSRLGQVTPANRTDPNRASGLPDGNRSRRRTAAVGVRRTGPPPGALSTPTEPWWDRPASRTALSDPNLQDSSRAEDGSPVDRDLRAGEREPGEEVRSVGASETPVPPDLQANAATLPLFQVGDVLNGRVQSE